VPISTRKGREKTRNKPSGRLLPLRRPADGLTRETERTIKRSSKLIQHLETTVPLSFAVALM
jgi:hypothetical protein